MSVGMRLIEAWRRVLELCRAGRDETVLVLVGEISHPDNVAACRLAATGIGARVLSLELGEPPRPGVAGESTAYLGPTALTGNRAAVEAMKHADLVIDMMGLDRGTEQSEVLATGTRILLVKEPPEVLLRSLPSEGDRKAVKQAAARLGRARAMTVESAAGTRFSARVGEYPLLVQYGIADEPGRWDHWPSAFVATWPNEGRAEGVMVLAPGDTILPFKSYVREPITLEISDGYIRKIAGAGLDTEYLRDYMASFDDPEGYAVSHIGWGLQPRASWTTLALYDKRQTNAMDARSFAGNFMFSTGPNAEAGGNRHTPCHLDIPMRGCSVRIDGEAVVENGRLVAA